MHPKSMKTIARIGRIAAGLAAPAAAAAVLFTSQSAEAHFQLLNPPPWIQQDFAGDPQKASPCGTDAQNAGTLTNDVTSYAPGQTVTLHFVETIAHDGWFRISLSYKNRTDLNDPPYQTYASGIMAGWSEDAGIENPAVPPVLVDGLFKHTANSITTPKDYTYDLKLPMEPCDKCTLQVEQIMLNHPVNQTDGPFTYHHCADISIVAGADGGTTTMTSDGGRVAVSIDSGVEGTASSGGTTTGGSNGSTGGSSGTGTTDDDAGGTAGQSSGSGSTGTSGTGDTGGSSSGCAASGGGGTTTAAAGFGLLVGAVAAGMRRRRRGTPTS
jgi:MYXO-CTERM domain-containing protein